MPASSEAVGAPGGGGDVEREEYEIRNDEGFVYRVPAGLHHDDAPSTTQSAAGPDPRAAALRRRRRALLRIRDRRLRELSRWEALASVLRAPLPAPQPPAALPASTHPLAAVASSSSSASASLDELLVLVDIQKEVVRQAQLLCDEANTLCHAHEAAIVDALPFWDRSPREQIKALISLDGGTAAPDSLGEQNDRQETSVVSSATAGMIKNSDDKQTGDDVTPPILTERRMRKRVTNLSNSNNVASKASVEPKRKKASWTAPMQTPGSTTRRKAEFPGTPRSKTRRTPASGTAPMQTPGSRTRRKAELPETPRSKTRRKPSEPRASDMFCSPGQLTRRKAAAENL